MAAQTLFDKIWESHVVRAEPDGTTLLYIDRQLVHEVTSPQAFEGLKLSGRRPRRSGATLAVPDHNVPTTDRTMGIADPLSAKQIQTLEENCHDFSIALFGMTFFLPNARGCPGSNIPRGEVCGSSVATRISDFTSALERERPPRVRWLYSSKMRTACSTLSCSPSMVKLLSCNCVRTRSSDSSRRRFSSSVPKRGSIFPDM